MKPFESQRLVLREFQLSDVDALYEIQGDCHPMRFTHWSESREACSDWLSRYEDTRSSNGFAPWVAVQRAQQQVIGWGGLNIDPFLPGWGIEVSYFIHSHFAGQGYASELVRAALKHGFDDLALESIGAFVKPSNEGSLRVLNKCGFQFVRYEAELERDRFLARYKDWRLASKLK
jgi:ribosomal-protein-alanine N-acetyltransferase